MSEILKALKQSEQQHQSFGAYSSGPVETNSNRPSPLPKRKLVVAFLLPIMATSIWIGVDTYLFYEELNQRETASSNIVVETVEVESPFSSSPYVLVEPLKSTQLGLVEVAQGGLPSEAHSNEAKASTVTAARIDEEINGARINDSDVDALSQLDLSQFSPELAQRVQSAFPSGGEDLSSYGTGLPSELAENESPNQLPSNIRTNDITNERITEEPESIKLVQKGADFVGHLPALNFQTHVYSSQKSKRWVKVNGSEFTEGDWINPEIQILEIKQRYSTIDFQGQRIEVPALYDWKG
ncbi:general secretion pathway protein GspB [Vibrio amylolyticus]|uniref:general secretion pathway protein GspB n=1 Tax=Vibrio amylolyticus TaxID=2847292 RepID=UPI00354C7C17